MTISLIDNLYKLWITAGDLAMNVNTTQVAIAFAHLFSAISRPIGPFQRWHFV